jgi:hypothetical protein
MSITPYYDKILDELREQDLTQTQADALYLKVANIDGGLSNSLYPIADIDGGSSI